MGVPLLINVLKGIALFGILGPIIGVLTVALPAMATTGDWSIRSLLLLVPAAYFVGGIPAAASGLIVGVARARLCGFIGAMAAGAIGAACSIGYYLLLSIHGDLDRAAVLFAAAGLASGLVCGIIFRAPPNNSFKPTQLRGGNVLRLGRSYLPPLRRSA